MAQIITIDDNEIGIAIRDIRNEFLISGSRRDALGAHLKRIPIITGVDQVHETVVLI